MAVLTKQAFAAFCAAKTIIEKRLKTLTEEEVVQYEAFCEALKDVQRRQEEQAQKNRDAVNKYAKNPEHHEKIRATNRKAVKAYRERKKQESS